ncbi:MAG: hypothetical protein JJU05_17980 [Verrucomicrobia bacterium]|nr:hypothetical protein [Verrucomicrobiota bacterium]MCH8526957.1 hypothetical protein [Kiritimatiellia bacterium]
MIPVRFLITLALLAVPASFVRGRDQTEPEPRVTFRITRFDPGDRPPPSYSLLVDEERVPVDIPIHYIAGPFTGVLRSGLYLDFYREDAESPAVTVEIPENLREDLLLVFLPGSEAGEYSVLPVQTPRSRIRGGDRMVLNASDTTVAIQYGETDPVVIAPGRSGMLSATGIDRISSVPVAILEKSEGNWRPYTSENWPHDPRVRTFLFLYRSNRTRQLTFHGVSERMDLNSR